jgi:hypothetical protein
MKRSEALKIIQGWATILDEVYCGDATEWADNFLYTLEHDLRMLPPSYKLDNIEDNGNSFVYSKNEWESEDEN